jgi:hypothetical protein
VFLEYRSINNEVSLEKKYKYESFCLKRRTNKRFVAWMYQRKKQSKICLCESATSLLSNAGKLFEGIDE